MITGFEGSCGQCRYWRISDVPEEAKRLSGYCRRFPPTPLITAVLSPEQITMAHQFPATVSMMWCGEYVPAKGAKQ